MTKTDILQLFAAISALYPRSDAFMVQDDGRGNLMVSLWRDMLADLSADVVYAALQVHAAGSAFPPSVAEIRQAVAGMMRPQHGLTEDEAWGFVTEAVRKYGYYQQGKAFASMPEDVRLLVKRFGFEELCLAERDQMGVIRGQFCRMWRTAQERKRMDSALPAALKERIAAIGQMPEPRRLKTLE